MHLHKCAVTYFSFNPIQVYIPSSNNKQKTFDKDIEYLSSKTKPTSLNIEEFLSKNLPPLTDFEEEYLATRLIQELPISSPMLDAQFFLHREAISVVQKNYRIKVKHPQHLSSLSTLHKRYVLLDGYNRTRIFLRFSFTPSTRCITS